MKLILLFLINLFTLFSYGQIELSATSGHLKLANFNDSLNVNAGLGIFPYQKLSLNFDVKNNLHCVIVADKKGQIVYRQYSGKGIYTCETGSDHKYLIIYDLVFNKPMLLTKDSGDFFNLKLAFGNDDVKVNIVDTPIPGHLDTLNKHFVRFLLIDEGLGFSNFSISLEKISNPTILTEPMMLEAGESERNFIVSNLIYEKLKKYILNNKYKFKSDTIGSEYQPALEINIDYKDRLYLKSNCAMQFLSELKASLFADKRFEIFSNQIKRMIDDLEYDERRYINKDLN